MKNTAYKSHDRTALQHPLWSLPAFEGKNSASSSSCLFVATSESFIKILRRTVAKSNPKKSLHLTKCLISIFRFLGGRRRRRRPDVTQVGVGLRKIPCGVVGRRRVDVTFSNLHFVGKLLFFWLPTSPNSCKFFPFFTLQNGS